MAKISWEIPIRTVSELNSKEHWTKKAKRHKSQQKFVKLALKAKIGQSNTPMPDNLDATFGKNARRP